MLHSSHGCSTICIEVFKKMLAELLEVESWGSESKKRYALKLEEC